MTTLQIQNLLSYLHGEYPKAGFSPGPLDGLDGPRTAAAILAFQKAFSGLAATGAADEATQKALRHAVAYGMEIPEEDVSESGTFWDDIQYFRREEFACRCGEYHAPYCDGFPVEPEETLVRLADRVRGHFGRPAHRSSGIRCRQHNADSGGVANSKHLYGKALDFFVEGVSGQQLLAYVQAQPETNYAYIIDGQYVHMDVK